MKLTGYLLALVAVMVAITFLSSCTQIESGHVGVRRTLGKINPEPLQPGLSWITPFVDSVESVNCKLQSFEVETAAPSKDLQLVKTVVAVQHSMIPALAPKGMAEIGNVEAFDATVIRPAVLESTKAIMARYTAEQLVTMRNQVKTEMDAAIQEFINHTLLAKGVNGAMDIANVAINDFDFSDQFNQSIEAKVQADQIALQAVANKRKTTTDAEALAAAKKLEADARAYEINAEAESKAKAIEIEGKALAANPNLVQLRFVESWDGKLPVYSGGGDAVPFMNITPQKEESTDVRPL
jgi:prohibitin 2